MFYEIDPLIQNQVCVKDTTDESNSILNEGQTSSSSGRFVPKATQQGFHAEDADVVLLLRSDLYHKFHHQVTSFQNCEMCFLGTKRWGRRAQVFYV